MFGKIKVLMGFVEYSVKQTEHGKQLLAETEKEIEDAEKEIERLKNKLAKEICKTDDELRRENDQLRKLYTDLDMVNSKIVIENESLKKAINELKEPNRIAYERDLYKKLFEDQDKSLINALTTQNRRYMGIIEEFRKKEK